MATLVFIPATADHAEELALTLRPEDTAEVLACGFGSAREALLLSLQRSEAAWAAMVDGAVAAMFGLGGSGELGACVQPHQCLPGSAVHPAQERAVGHS